MFFCTTVCNIHTSTCKLSLARMHSSATAATSSASSAALTFSSEKRREGKSAQPQSSAANR